MTEIRGTTVIAVRRGGQVAIAGDGQVTMGQTVLKKKARKIHRISNGRVLLGFAGSTADALALAERFEKKLEEFGGLLRRAAVELAKDWRTDRSMRQLEALLIAADRTETLVVSGTGDVIEPDHGVVAVGAGGPYALAAARALQRDAGLTAREIAEESIRIASEICLYTNDEISVEVLES